MKHIVIFTILIFIWLLIYLLNETPFLFTESREYINTDKIKYISPEAEPYYSEDSKKDTMILFIHGYKGSGHSLKEIAMFFKDKYNVSVPVLPGHGTSVEEFRKTCFSQWYNYVKELYIKYRKKYKYVYICGLSMGGTITLRLAGEFQEDKKLAPNGIITISAPVFLNKLIGEGVLHDWRLYFSRFLSWFNLVVKEHKKDVDEDGADWIGYEGFNFTRSIHSFKMGIYTARKGLKKIRVPILAMHSKGDKTVPFKNLSYISRKVSSKKIRIKEFDLRKWDHKRHILTLFNSSKNITKEEIKRFIEEN